MEFEAKVIQYKIDTGVCEEKKVCNLLELRQLICKEDKVTEIAISKHLRVYFSKNAYEDGVSCHVKIKEEKDAFTGAWISSRGYDFLFGNTCILVECDDEKPIDITEKGKLEILECIIKKG